MTTQLIIDLSQILYRCVFVQEQHVKDYGTDFLRHMTLQNIFKLIEDHNPDRVIIACDDKSNWRYEIYPKYKEHRSGERNKHDINWDEIFQFFDEFINELRNVFPFLVIHQQLAEADDIIATICSYQRGSDVTNIIVSNDKDFKCLLQYDNVKLFDPIKKEFVVCKNPKVFLRSLILRGDKSDNIPHIAPRIGEKTANKLAKNSELLKKKLSEDDEYRKNLKRNSMLIDPKYIPQIIKKKIKQKYDRGINTNRKNLLKYFQEHKLLKLFDDISHIDSMLSQLR